MKNQEELDNLPVDVKDLQKVFKKYRQVKLAYFFGSRATGTAGPLSDYDFAVYLNEKNNLESFNIRLKLMTDLSSLLKTNEVDVIVLNDAENPDLKYNIIKDGKLLVEKEPFKVLVEPRIISEYFDFNLTLFKNNLTKKAYV